MNSTNDTIVAIATPLGEGGLGVVRLSGPEAFMIADAIFKSKQKLADSPTHTLHHGWVFKGRPPSPYPLPPQTTWRERAKTHVPSPSMVCMGGEGQGEGGSFLDEAIAAVFRAPHSYTGEDVVEFSCHGSPTVLKEVVRLCIDNGARPADPGEFTQRAYLNGKMDLLQAEAVADLIHAQSSKARSVAAAQLQGVLSARLNDIRQQLIDLLAQIEANLDFVEEKLPAISKRQISGVLKKVKGKLMELLATSVRGRLLREGLRVALAGKPNVGKSSLFNALLAQDRAIVTDIPGTTRDTLEEKLEWDGMPVVLTDTAGLRSSVDKIEAHGAERAKRAHQMSHVVLLVLDGSRPLEYADKKIITQLKSRRVVAALNKSDKVQKIKQASLPGWIRKSVVAVSAKTGARLAELRKTIIDAAGRDLLEVEDTVTITNERHARHLELAAQRISAVLRAVQQGKSEEALSLDIRGALENLSAITGHNVTDEVLTSIFHQFCIGK